MLKFGTSIWAILIQNRTKSGIFFIIRKKTPKEIEKIASESTLKIVAMIISSTLLMTRFSSMPLNLLRLITKKAKDQEKRRGVTKTKILLRMSLVPKFVRLKWPTLTTLRNMSCSKEILLQPVIMRNLSISFKASTSHPSRCQPMVNLGRIINLTKILSKLRK